MTHRRPPVRSAGTRAAIALGLAGATLAGCGLTSTDCTAVGHNNVLTVELAGGWTPPAGATLQLACSGPCPPEVGDGGPDEWTSSLTGTTADVNLGMTAPGSVVLTVLDPTGSELAEVAAELEWTRVGGSEECGGPSAATLIVPAP